MKSIPSALQAHYDTGATTTATLWKVTRRDAQVFGFTDHDRSLDFGGVTYATSSAFSASAVATRSEFNVDTLEVVGLLDSAGIAAADIEAGLWDGAAVEIRRVNWASLGDGAEIIRVGEIGQVQRRQGGYVAELRGLMQALQGNIGRVINTTCDATLGDARCGVNAVALTVSSTITTATSRRQFTASGLAQAADYFTGGLVTFTGGLNDGIAREIKRHQTGGVLELYLPFPFDTTVADPFDIVPGCDKTKPTCIAKFNNLANFRGFSFVPGQDRTLIVGSQQ